MTNSSDLDLIKILRQETLASLSKCKEALKESDGDLDKARDFLKKSNAIIADKKSSRQTDYGICAVEVNKDKAVLLNLCCETSSSAQNFVLAELAADLAKEILLFGNDKSNIENILTHNTSNGDTIEQKIKHTIGSIGENITLNQVEIITAPNMSYYVHNKAKDSKAEIMNNVGAKISLVGFKTDNNQENLDTVGKDIAMHIAGIAHSPIFIRADEISNKDMEEYQKPILEQIMEQFKGKPQNIIDNILKGKLANLLSEKVLELQPFIKDDSHTVGSFAKQHGINIELFRLFSAKR